MTRRTALVDRVALAVVGLALAAVGLLAVDWRLGPWLDLPDTLDLAAVRDVVASSWWPWASAAGGVVLGLLGLLWLLAHLPHRGPGRGRLGASDQTGTLEVDLRSLSSRVADRLAELAPVSSTRGSTTRLRGRTVLLVRARLEPAADPDAVAEGVRRCRDEVEQALEGEVGLRVLVDAPRRARRTDDRVRVQ